MIRKLLSETFFDAMWSRYQNKHDDFHDERFEEDAMNTMRAMINELRSLRQANISLQQQINDIGKVER